MGCDIHLTVERKIANDWICVNTVNHHDKAPGRVKKGELSFSIPAALERNYNRFAALASVRGDGQSPRGLPSDMSQTTKMLTDDWASDGHSHSWMPIKDAAQIFLDTEYGEVSDFIREYPPSTYFGVEANDLDNYRVVFWFDN